MFFDGLFALLEKYKKNRDALEHTKEQVILKSGNVVFKVEAKAIVRLLMGLERNHYTKFVEIARLSQSEFESRDDVLRFVNILQTPQMIADDPQCKGLLVIVNSTPLQWRRIIHDALEDKKIVSPVNNLTLEQFLAS